MPPQAPHASICDRITTREIYFSEGWTILCEASNRQVGDQGDVAEVDIKRSGQPLATARTPSSVTVEQLFSLMISNLFAV